MLSSTTRRLGVVLDLWCIPCGELAALDVVANIVLFMPLAFALAVAMNRRWLPGAVALGGT